MSEPVCAFSNNAKTVTKSDDSEAVATSYAYSTVRVRAAQQ